MTSERVERPRGRREVLGLLRQIQALLLELAEPEQAGRTPEERAAKERALERLHWRLGAVARRAARDDLGVVA